MALSLFTFVQVSLIFTTCNSFFPRLIWVLPHSHFPRNTSIQIHSGRPPTCYRGLCQLLDVPPYEPTDLGDPDVTRFEVSVRANLIKGTNLTG